MREKRWRRWKAVAHARLVGVQGTPATIGSVKEMMIPGAVSLGRPRPGGETKKLSGGPAADKLRLVALKRDLTFCCGVIKSCWMSGVLTDAAMVTTPLHTRWTGKP